MFGGSLAGSARPAYQPLMISTIAGCGLLSFTSWFIAWNAGREAIGSVARPPGYRKVSVSNSRKLAPTVETSDGRRLTSSVVGDAGSVGRYCTPPWQVVHRLGTNFCPKPSRSAL